MTKVLAWIIAVVAIIASIALSVIQNLASGMPFLLALALPIAFVGFVNLIFEVGWGLFIKAHQGKLVALSRLKKELLPEAMKIVRTRVIGGVLCILASLTLESINVLTIIGGQVHTMQVAVTATVSASSSDLSANVDDLESDKRELISQQTELTTRWTQRRNELNRVMVNVYPKMADRIASPEYAEYKTQEKAYDAAYQSKQSEIDAKQREIEKARESNLTAKTKESATESAFVGSVYAFIGKVFSVDPINVQFWMTALPSFFLGIISCVSLSLALYSKSNKRKEEEK